MKTLCILILSSIILVNSAQARQNNHSHDTHLDTLVEHYLEIKDALVADDLNSAKNAFNSFADEVRNNVEMNEHSMHADKHQDHHDRMLKAVATADSAQTIKTFRSAFSELSVELLTALENQNYEHPSLFVQFCPMANGGKGARWISDEEKIANPFYGKMMHSCGETVNRLGY